MCHSVSVAFVVRSQHITASVMTWHVCVVVAAVVFLFCVNTAPQLHISLLCSLPLQYFVSFTQLHRSHHQKLVMQSSSSSSNHHLNNSNSNNSSSNSSNSKAQRSSNIISSVHTRESLSLLSWYVTNMPYVLASCREPG